jgi:GNAT superfamily N-acetyltransferase
MIRAANAFDVERIQALMQSVAGFWNESWRTDVLERALASTETIALVHQEAEIIDGFACAHDLAFRAYLSELVVLPSAQSRGVGGQLLAEIERRLKERDCSVVIADVWRDAESFYCRRGWSPPAVTLLCKRLA